MSYNPLDKLGYNSSPVFVIENAGESEELYSMFSKHIDYYQKYSVQYQK